MKKRISNTFTLIEMLVVIIVIGLLASSLIPRLLSTQERARDSVRKKDIRELTTALILYFNDNNRILTAGSQTTFTSPAITMHASTSSDWLSGLVPNYITRKIIDPVNTVNTSILTGSIVYMYNSYASGQTFSGCTNVGSKSFGLLTAARLESNKTPQANYNQNNACPGPGISDYGTIVTIGGISFSRGDSPTINTGATSGGSGGTGGSTGGCTRLCGGISGS